MTILTLSLEEQLAERLCAYLERHGLTHKQFAAILKVSESTVSRAANGIRVGITKRRLIRDRVGESQ